MNFFLKTILFVFTSACTWPRFFFKQYYSLCWAKKFEFFWKQYYSLWPVWNLNFWKQYYSSLTLLLGDLEIWFFWNTIFREIFWKQYYSPLWQKKISWQKIFMAKIFSRNFFWKQYFSLLTLPVGQLKIWFFFENNTIRLNDLKIWYFWKQYYSSLTLIVG